ARGSAERRRGFRSGTSVRRDDGPHPTPPFPPLARQRNPRYARAVERDMNWSTEALVGETRANVGHVRDDVNAVRQDVRRLDDRLFQLMLMTLATLATTIASLV